VTSPAFSGTRSFGEADLEALLELNRLRAGAATPGLRELESRFASAFAADRRLAVYGSLAPGRANHSQLRDLLGEWHSGLSVTGELVRRGWGADLGYLALLWSATGPDVPVQLFVSEQLPLHWARLDEFEGPDYLRILVPVASAGVVVAVANLYAARPGPAA
jgi:gamma-glutamylcyclotransferase (GGCT)/AIG2-like uncharacterized protein YtfP